LAANDSTSRPADRERETLDQFADRFGQLSDRYDQAVHTALERTEMPTAEHPDAIKERRAEEAEQGREEPHHTWPDERVKPDFEKAVANARDPSEYVGRGSMMVRDDQPEHNLKPPENSEDQDRAAHRQRMARDDALSRVQMTDKYYEKMAQRLEEYDRRQAYEEQHPSQDRSQDYDQSR
jgi:hypothetical protein